MVRSGECFMFFAFCLAGSEHLSFLRVTAIADKLGVEFALIHRKKDRHSIEPDEERMELLVGDVKDKVRGP